MIYRFFLDMYNILYIPYTMILPGSSVSIWIYLFVLFALEVYVCKCSCFLNVGTIEEAAKADHKPASWARLARSPELDLSV